MMRIVANEDIPSLPWQHLLITDVHASPFQSESFYRLFCSTENVKAEAYAVEEGSALLALVVITYQKEKGIAAFFSSRAIIYGGPLVHPDHPEALDMLLNYLKKNKQHVIYTETRNLADYSSYKSLFLKHKWKYIPYINYVIYAGSKESVIKSMSESRFRQIRKAEKRGVTWREAKTREDISAFYTLLSDLYRHKIGKPLLPRSFFEGFVELHLGPVLLVEYGGKVIGGIVCPVLDRRRIYEMYICGLDNEYRDMYPSVMATWAAIEYAIEKGISVFDFMGAGRSDEEYGVREFKSRFGGTMIENGRFLKVSRPFLYSVGTIGIKLRIMIRK